MQKWTTAWRARPNDARGFWKTELWNHGCSSRCSQTLCNKNLSTFSQLWVSDSLNSETPSLRAYSDFEGVLFSVVYMRWSTRTLHKGMFWEQIFRVCDQLLSWCNDSTKNTTTVNLKATAWVQENKHEMWLQSYQTTTKNDHWIFLSHLRFKASNQSQSQENNLV